MSHRFFALVCLLVLFSVALQINGDSNVIEILNENSDTELSDAKALAEIRRRVLQSKYRKTPAMAVASIIAKATCYITGAEECALLSTTFQTPDEILKCIKQYALSNQGPCAINL